MLEHSAYDKVDTDCEAWEVDDRSRDTAKSYLKQLETVPEVCSKPYDVLSAGCIFLACRQCGVPRAFRDISQSSNLPKKDIGKMYKLLEKHLALTQTAEIPGTDAEMELSYLRELGLLFRDTAPIMLSFCFQNLVQACSSLICGRLGTFELSVASYGYMFFSATAAMVALGGSTAIDTLCSQAFTSRHSAGRKDYLGIVLQRGLIFLTVFFLAIITPIWWQSGALFRALGQEAQFSEATELFLKYMLPAGVLQIFAECIKKFLQVQNHSTAVGWCIAIAAVVGVVANYLLIMRTSLGLNGAPLAHAIYHGSTIITMLVFIMSSKSARAYWGGFTTKAFYDFGPFTFLALAGILTVATEFWCFESLALMAATLNSASVGAQSIIMTSDLILATVPLGLSVAASHRIGKSLGAGNGKLAGFQSRMPYLLALIVGLIEAIVLVSVRNVYGRIFSPDVDVVKTTSTILPILAVFQCLDISNGGAAGILRGAAKTHYAGISNVIGYYGVGMVLAWAFCFKLHLGLFGLWAGLVCGSAALLMLQTGFILSIKWEKEAERVVTQAAKRAEGEREPLLGRTDEALLTHRP